MVPTEIEMCEDFSWSVRCMNRCYYDQQECVSLCEDEFCQYVKGFHFSQKFQSLDLPVC